MIIRIIVNTPLLNNLLAHSGLPELLDVSSRSTNVFPSAPVGLHSIYISSPLSPIILLAPFLLNDSPSVVKSFKTLMYEGSQAKITQDLTDNQYYNLQNKKGWYLQDMSTDMQVGANVEFIEKENKWFNYIKGVDNGNIEEKDFTYQGIGVVSSQQLSIDNNSNQS